MPEFIKNLPGDIRVLRYERRKEIVFALIIFLATSFSFGLGYLLRRDYSYAPIIIEKCSSTSTVSH